MQSAGELPSCYIWTSRRLLAVEMNVLFECGGEIYLLASSFSIASSILSTGKFKLTIHRNRNVNPISFISWKDFLEWVDGSDRIEPSHKVIDYLVIKISDDEMMMMTKVMSKFLLVGIFISNSSTYQIVASLSHLLLIACKVTLLNLTPPPIRRLTCCRIIGKEDEETYNRRKNVIRYFKRATFWMLYRAFRLPSFCFWLHSIDPSRVVVSSSMAADIQP